jgi:hypothetical protein
MKTKEGKKMLGKSTKNKLGIVRKTEILLKLLNGEDGVEEIYPKLSAFQMQDLRNFLENQILHFSARQDENPLTLAELKSRLEPIPNYYYKQDCREPLDSCYNETCIASYPGCFSKKMKTQFDIILELLKQYLTPRQIAK